MDLVKICNEFKSYLSRADVTAACDTKIHKGLVKIAKESRDFTMQHKLKSEDLNDFYSKAPASLKLFKQDMLTKAVSSYNTNLEGTSIEVKAYTVYLRAIHFLTILKLCKFYTSVKADNDAVTAESTGVSKAVFARAKLAQSVLDLKEDEIRQKAPDKASLRYIEMGLKRIITMEVGSDDWNK